MVADSPLLPMPRDTRSLGAHTIAALIPARAGSVRVPGKNTKPLAGTPLIRYTLDLATSCDLFSAVIVSTDDPGVRAIARGYPGVCVHERHPDDATATAPDIRWVQAAMQDRPEDIFCILRPTSPFRTVSTIRRAYAKLIGSGADSVRAVERVSQHPGKMWQLLDGATFMYPLLDRQHPDGTPWHSSPTQTLPVFYVQNASLEMAWTRVLTTFRTIHGMSVAPFLTEPREGIDINTPEDFSRAEWLMLHESEGAGHGG